ncbi:MAG: hypothetical protein EAZ92_14050 [Candidatus Kapaibacterium sp.]|nr:MAG: hypothetical protein EAZ92_14050 [Candidatus Kapabacteria bacterium]
MSLLHNSISITMNPNLLPMTPSFVKRVLLPPAAALVFYGFIRLTADGSWSETFINLERPLRNYIEEIIATIVLFYALLEGAIVVRRHLAKRYGAILLKSAYLLKESQWIAIFFLALINAFGLPFTALTDDGLSFNDAYVLNVTGVGCTIVYLASTRGRDYIRLFNQAELDLERYKQEHATAQFQALQHQLNPHFLFNSLNTLSSLVHRDADAADDFIRELAKVYRYVLDAAKQETVPLRTELAFLESYAHLLKTRFKSAFEINIEIREEYLDLRLPPMTLQILVENAVKHNIVSTQKPLHCSISDTNNACLLVKNNLQERSEKDTSSSVGLANLQSRYEFLNKREDGIQPRVSLTETEFLVTIPLLED